MLVLFFFSSRRRHTRCLSDWSSDVCSSDLAMSATVSLSVFATMDFAALTDKLTVADIAFARVSDMAALGRHPHLGRVSIATPGGPVALPAPAALLAAETRRYGPVASLGEHTEKVRMEFMSREREP